MRPPLLATCLITTVLGNPINHLQLRQASPDIITSGLYSIQGCGSRAPLVISALDSLWTLLQPALNDSAALHTSASFNAFFQDISYAPFVHSILSKISAGEPAAQRNPLPSFPASSPVLACLQEEPYAVPSSNVLGLRPQIQHAAYGDCMDGKLMSSAVWMGGTAVVVLCPRLFTYKPQPERRTCFAVDRAANCFQSLGAAVQKTRVYVLLHELVHIYVGAAVDQRALTGEAMSVQDSWGMLGRYARFNPSNYAFYVNSVNWGCTNFPQRSSGDGRELMALSSNSSMSRSPLNETSDTVWLNNSGHITEPQ